MRFACPGEARALATGWIAFLSLSVGFLEESRYGDPSVQTLHNPGAFKHRYDNW